MASGSRGGVVVVGCWFVVSAVRTVLDVSWAACGSIVCVPLYFCVQAWSDHCVKQLRAEFGVSESSDPLDIVFNPNGSGSLNLPAAEKLLKLHEVTFTEVRARVCVCVCASVAC